MSYRVPVACGLLALLVALFVCGAAGARTRMSAPEGTVDVPVDGMFMKPDRGTSGEALFKEHCAACHPAGGNIMRPEKTLSARDRERNGIITAADIVRKMRNPGPAPTHPSEWAGMKLFDERTISDQDAHAIADFILRTFK